MKITLEFEDLDEAEHYLKSQDYFEALNYFKNWIRGEWKHGDHDEKEFEMLDKIYDKFNKTLTNYNIEI